MLDGYRLGASRMWWRIVFAGGFLALILFGRATAGQFEDGLAAAYGRPPDYEAAMRLLRPLADQGDARAQDIVADIYQKGYGIPQDYAQAAKWFRKAADRGDSGGQFGLGWLYFHGYGVPRDYVQAHMWLNLAASHASDEDREFAGYVRDQVAAKLTPAQIAEAQRMAREWVPK
jgi:TPR repeat protein